MINIDVLAGIMLAAAGFYWVVASAIAVVVCGIRCRGCSSISAVPAVAIVTGVVCFVILKSCFQMITSNLWLAAFLLFDTILACGEVVLWFQFRVLRLPDKPQQQPTKTFNKGLHRSHYRASVLKSTSTARALWIWPLFGRNGKSYLMKHLVIRLACR